MPYYSDGFDGLESDYERNEDGWLDAAYEDRYLNDLDHEIEFEFDYSEDELAQFDINDELNAADEMAWINDSDGEY
jgi:hypothetical protein